MTQIKRFFIFLCTLPLLDILLTFWLHWDELHANPDRMSGGGFLLLFGGFFATGLIAGVIFAKLSQLSPKSLAFYSLLSAFVFPETYLQLWRTGELFGSMFLFFNCQQAFGFTLGAGMTMLMKDR